MDSSDPLILIRGWFFFLLVDIFLNSRWRMAAILKMRFIINRLLFWLYQYKIWDKGVGLTWFSYLLQTILFQPMKFKMESWRPYWNFGVFFNRLILFVYQCKNCEKEANLPWLIHLLNQIIILTSKIQDGGL